MFLIIISANCIYIGTTVANTVRKYCRDITMFKNKKIVLLSLTLAVRYSKKISLGSPNKIEEKANKNEEWRMEPIKFLLVHELV